MCYPIRYISRWLSLSRTLPMDIIFERGILLGHTQVFAELFMDMGDHSRCRSLDLFLTKSSALALIYFVNLPPGSLRFLESLVLEGLDESDFVIESNLPSGITVFQASPRLQELTTDRLDFTYSLDQGLRTFNRHVLPWPQLTKLLITEFLDVEIFVAALVECAALQFLRVSLDLSDHLDDDTPNIEDYMFRLPVTLPHLTELYISFRDGLFFPPAMDLFTFPALTHLRFRRTQGRTGPSSYNLQRLDPFSWIDSKHFLQQLRQLQQLTLVGHVGGTEQIRILLRCTPRLTKLSLDIHTDYPTLIPAIFPYPLRSRYVACPASLLTDLELHLGECDMPVSLDQLRNLVDSEESCLLRNLRIHTEEDYHVFRMEAMEKFPATSKVKLWQGVPSRSARNLSDANLLDHHLTRRAYVMFDPGFH